mgnify:CR=1 FL=1|jgi:hypothetical protein
MLLAALSTCALAFGIHQISRNALDEVHLVTFSLIKWSCLCIGLVLTPWVVKGLIAVVLLAMPHCGLSTGTVQQGCPRFCALKVCCHTPTNHGN